MKKVLLVLDSDILREQICKDLQKDHHILSCGDADAAIPLLEQKPDAMILELDLPGIDGLTFLEQIPFHPPVILVIGKFFSPYTSQRLLELEVGYTMRTPIRVIAVTNRLRDMLQNREDTCMDSQTEAVSHLTALGISLSEDGARYLRVGIPLYAQDREQRVTKELYPAVAKVCRTTGVSVEHGIRSSIQSAWDNRDADCWRDYFPRHKTCPSNKVFISTLAEKLWPE